MGAAAVCRAPGWARVEGWGLWRVLRGRSSPPEPGPCPWLALQSHRVRDRFPLLLVKVKTDLGIARFQRSVLGLSRSL